MNAAATHITKSHLLITPLWVAMLLAPLSLLNSPLGAQQPAAEPAKSTATSTTASSAKQGSAWTIAVREVPAPAGAVAELTAAITASPAPDVEAARASTPKTKDDWLAMQKASSNANLDQLAAAFGLTIDQEMIAGVRVYRVTPNEVDARHSNHLFLHVHGGAYVFNGGDSSASEAAIIAARARIETLSVDYRMPPDHPFPAAVDDVVAVYRHLLRDRSAKTIAIGGTSAGGGLSLAAVHKFRALDVETPGAIYAGTPWADLTKTGDTLYTNEGIDRVLVTYDGVLGAAARLYADGHDLSDPLLSPVYGGFEGFPPTYFVTGTRDMFLSDTVRTHRKMRAAGVVADLNVYEGHSHADYLILARSSDSQQVFEELGDFLLQHLE